MRNNIYSVSKSTTKLTSNIRKLNAKRRVIAQHMIDEANETLEHKRCNSIIAIHEAIEQRKKGVSLLAMAS